MAKSFSPSWRDNQSSAFLVIIYFNPFQWSVPVVSLAAPFYHPAKEEHFAHQRQREEPARMRLKLVIAASLLAAIVGAGSCIALVLGFFSVQALSKPGLLVTSTLLLPIATIAFASIFVYRHTARRRRLQAMLTALLAIVLTLAFFITASILSARRNRTEPPTPVGPHVAS